MLRALTVQLEVYVGRVAARAQREYVRCENELEANAVLERRDYVFCLCPESVLRPFCTRFLSIGDA